MAQVLNLSKRLKKKGKQETQTLFSIDSTIIKLTNKLLWVLLDPKPFKKVGDLNIEVSSFYIIT